MGVNLRLFCQKVLLGEYKNIEQICETHEDNLLKVDIKGLGLQKENFDMVIMDICQELFSIRSSHPAYIIAVFCFSKKVDQHYKIYNWYNQDMLVDILTDILNSVLVEPQHIIQYCDRELYFKTYCIII